jgi:peptidoglycan glycosyltransferase
VNKPIVRIYVVILILFAGLVGFTSYWSVFHADDLKGMSLNHRPLIEDQTIKRGTITTADGQVVAVSTPEGGGANPIYVRHYPQNELYGHPIGTSYVLTGQSELEQSENDSLVGSTNEFTSILDELRGHAQVGNNVELTIDSRIQKTAFDALTSAEQSTTGTNGAGAVVAMDPQTGAIKAMVSLPAYDPNSVASPKTYDKLNNPHNTAAQLLNRATQSQYPPGSTMKVLTAAAGLDSGDFTPTTTLNAPATIEVSGAPLANDDGQDYGPIDMATALTNSVNTFFAQVGEKVGIPTMVEYMKRFGFYSDPKLDLPDADMSATGPRNSNGDLVTDGFDVGRVAIGQGGAEGQMLATPLQMAEVASTVANDGALMKPSLVQKVTDPDGRTVSELKPSVQSQAIKPETAKELNAMMVQVTQEGTAAGLTVSGAPFAGKTGTAEIDIANSINQPWFIGFAPANDPKIAVAVTLERCTSCFGGTVAGPVATQVMEAALAAGQ